ncbi:MAG: 16S rRNA (guanine(527)-N(7))-methyltransferase RsmG [Anaerolineae bacterium]|jgi:16S rRNA (guanine527-N7)-methyltransferase
MEPLILGARELGLTLTQRQLVAFETCFDALVAWNEHFNLTAITDWKGVLVRHFLDSLSCLKAIPPAALADGARVIDVGTGAGYPGIPLKIVCPAIQLTLLEATHKKVTFLEHMIAKLGLKDVWAIHARAEQVGQDPAHREQYDWAVARAVAKMPTLVEYLLPLAKVGGAMLAQKGEDAPADVHEAGNAIATLGGEVRQLVSVELRGLAETRYLVVVDKIAPTPEKYPRRPGVPNKRPLV